MLQFIKGVQGCRAKKYCSIEFFHFFPVSSSRCPLQHISFSWSLPDHQRETMKFQLPPFVKNVKFKVKFGFRYLKINFDGIFMIIMSILLRINESFKSSKDMAFLQNKFRNSGIFSQNVSLKMQCLRF